jgi:hypothetical protein
MEILTGGWEKFVLLSKYYYGDQVKEDEKGGLCGT